MSKIPIIEKDRAIKINLRKEAIMTTVYHVLIITPDASPGQIWYFTSESAAIDQRDALISMGKNAVAYSLDVTILS